MANSSEQNLANHARFDPKFHFVVVPICAITFLGTVVHAVGHAMQGKDVILHVWYAVMAFGALLAILTFRLYALKVQDRVIRLEERLRLRDLAPETFRPRIGELTVGQLIALRFASDDEVVSLAGRALQEKLTAKQIKQAIQKWRPDTLRV